MHGAPSAFFSLGVVNEGSAFPIAARPNIAEVTNPVRSSFPLLTTPPLAETLPMKNLYEPGLAKQIEERLAQLKPDSPRQWGRMNAAQAVAHCAGAMEWAVDDCHRPRTTSGRILGWAIKPMVLRDDKPLRPGAPTDKTLVMTDEKNESVDSVHETGPDSGFTRGRHL